ncbi:MAG: TIM barrel protein, partial [Alphaproteobacteria bacterium]|nr:TIM barrel protein [Alphaproteobacteria bacterium]
MLKFCANLGWLFTEHDFLDRFAAAAKAGFKGVEFANPYQFQKRDLVQRLQDHGLQQILINMPAGNWNKGERGIACHPDRVAEFRVGVKTAIDYAQALDCKQINCLAGIAPQGVAQAKLWSTLAENLHFAAEHLARENIDLLVEPISAQEFPGFFLNTSADGLNAITACGHPNIKLQYDIYHMQRSEGELAATLTRLLPVIGHIQLADNPGRGQPGTGE